jgi:hypothetical protein
MSETHQDAPANRETITANGEAHEIETRRLTLLCHQGDVRIDVPSRFEITPQITVEQAEMMNDRHLELLREAGGEQMFRMMFGDAVAFPASAADLKREGMGIKHAIGLLALAMLCIGAGVPAFLRYPESYLHPRAQLDLADVLAGMTVPCGTGHDRVKAVRSSATASGTWPCSTGASE